jgi:hypothetical protein
LVASSSSVCRIVRFALTNELIVPNQMDDVCTLNTRRYSPAAKEQRSGELDVRFIVANRHYCAYKNKAFSLVTRPSSGHNLRSTSPKLHCLRGFDRGTCALHHRQLDYGMHPPHSIPKLISIDPHLAQTDNGVLGGQVINYSADRRQIS